LIVSYWLIKSKVENVGQYRNICPLAELKNCYDKSAHIKKVVNKVDNLPKIVVATVQISNFFLSDLRLIADLDL
jgi:hypothetical protein